MEAPSNFLPDKPHAQVASELQVGSRNVKNYRKRDRVPRTLASPTDAAASQLGEGVASPPAPAAQQPQPQRALHARGPRGQRGNANLVPHLATEQPSQAQQQQQPHQPQPQRSRQGPRPVAADVVAAAPASAAPASDPEVAVSHQGGRTVVRSRAPKARAAPAGDDATPSQQQRGPRSRPSKTTQLAIDSDPPATGQRHVVRARPSKTMQATSLADNPARASDAAPATSVELQPAPAPALALSPAAASDPATALAPTTVSSFETAPSVSSASAPEISPQPTATSQMAPEVASAVVARKPAAKPPRDREAEVRARYGAQTELATQIITRLLTNSYECMICIQVVGRQARVWACSQCYALFHVTCIRTWSRAAEGAVQWRCPACQLTCTGLPAASCFCRKHPEVEFNPYQLPHSCGELCGRRRTGDCPHPCSLVCHPGPCPPCPALGPLRTCHCGASSYRLRCGEKDPGKSCAGPCGRTLSCGSHVCTSQCHPPPCAPCAVTNRRTCYCGRTSRDLPCGQGTADPSPAPSCAPGFFVCEEVCGRRLECGNHSCMRKCHAGLCGVCELLPALVTVCPCGKTPLAQLPAPARVTCTDPVATCGKPCGRTLACGLHKCKRACHAGSCGDCPEQVPARCRCGSSTAQVRCGGGPRPVRLCSSLCKTLRSCGRHQCNVKCCPAAADPRDHDGLHVCKLVCGRTLKCALHKCDAPCHKGKCPPCVHVSLDDYVCTCGSTQLSAPIPCGTPLPVCTNTCSRPHACSHPVTHYCHQQPSCPPCVFLTEKWCVGHHELRKGVPCHIREPTCNRTCGRNLSCGRHVCQKPCHGGPCEAEHPDRTAMPCGQVCGADRIACPHKCDAPCHPGSPCPSTPCKALVRLTCPCGLRTQDVSCEKGGPEEPPAREPPSCDEACELEKRNRRLADAFGKLAGDGREVYTWPADLVEQAAQVPAFVVQLEKKFAEFLSGASPALSLPPMSRNARRLVHELAKAYQLDTASVQPEPDRFPLLVRRRESRIPHPLLSSMLGGSRPRTICALHLYDLSPSVLTLHLVAFLSPFEGKYQLKWVDDGNALAIFQSQEDLRSALHVLGGNPQYKVKEYHEGSLPQLDDLALAQHASDKAPLSRPPVAAASSRPPRPVAKPTPASRDDEFFEYRNFFAPLAASSSTAATPQKVAAPTPAPAASALGSSPPAPSRLGDPVDSWEQHEPPTPAVVSQPVSVLPSKSADNDTAAAAPASSSSYAGAAGSAPGGGAAAEWECPRCTLHNPARARVCEACEAPKKG